MSVVLKNTHPFTLHFECFISFSECDLIRNLAYPPMSQQTEKYRLMYSSITTVHYKNSVDLRALIFPLHIQYGASVTFCLKESINFLFNSLQLSLPQITLLTLHLPNTYLTNNWDYIILSSFQWTNRFVPARLNTISGVRQSLWFSLQ